MKERILKVMRDVGEPVRPGELAEALGADGKEISKAIKELRAEGRVVSPKRCFYAPA